MSRPAVSESFFESAEAAAQDGGIYLDQEPQLGSLPSVEGVEPARKGRHFSTVTLANVEMRDPEWLLRGFVPAGELTLLVGNGGVGKGSWCALLAAAVTRGKGECQNGEPGLVLWASAEDSIASVLKPRLVAARADLELVKPFRFQHDGIDDALCLPEDVPALREAVEDLNARLVIVDPLLSHLSGKVDSYRDHEVKRALMPLAQMANETGCTVVGAHHFTKSVAAGALAAIQASGAFANTARIALAMVEHDEDEDVRVLEVVKTNISRKGLRRAIRIELVDVPGLTEKVPRAASAGEADKSVDELLGSRSQPKGAKRQDAAKLVLALLAAGEQSMDYLKNRAAADLGVSGDTVWRAANGLKAEGRVDCGNSGPGTPWKWHLLTSASVPADPHE